MSSPEQPQPPRAEPVDYSQPSEAGRGPVMLIAILVAAAVLIGGGVAAYVLLASSPSQPATAAAPAAPTPSSATAKPRSQPVLLGEPAFTAEADDVLAEVLKDKNAFHTSRYNKVVEITGEVTAIRDDLTGQRFLALSGGVERTLGVRCFFADANRFQFDDLERGERVVIRGRYESVEPDVILRDAGVVKVLPQQP